MTNVAGTTQNQEAQFIQWLVAADECALAGVVKGHRCKGARQAVRGGQGGHVLLCARAADELHARDGVFASTDEQIRELFDSLILAALARCETTRLEALLERSAA